MDSWFGDAAEIGPFLGPRIVSPSLGGGVQPSSSWGQPAAFFQAPAPPPPTIDH